MASCSGASSRMSASTSLTPGLRRASATNSRRPVRKSSTITTSTPSALRRSARLLPMNPAPPVMHARFIGRARESVCGRLQCEAAHLEGGPSSLQSEARGHRVAVEHPDRLQRVLIEVLAETVELLEQVVGHGDDVAADLIGLHEVENLAR